MSFTLQFRRVNASGYILIGQISITRVKDNRPSCPYRETVFCFQRGFDMLSWALIFLIVAIIAGALGLSGIAGAATNIAWILFVIGLIVALIFFLTGRRP